MHSCSHLSRAIVAIVIALSYLLGAVVQVAAEQPGSTRAAKKAAVSESDAKEIAIRVARERFGGQGVAKTDLQFDRITARFEPGRAGSKEPHGTWRVFIPESNASKEPSGFHLLIDAETAKWTLPIVE
jgi:hypothetical protein